MADTIRIGLGTTVDAEYQALLDAGYEGALNDMMFQWLGDNGHTGGSLTDRLISYRAASGGITDLSELFSAGEAGFWYDLQDMSTLWQDDAGTISVTTDGDPIGRIDDKSGNGNHAVQATATSRPIFRTSGGKNWMELDQVDDNMLVGPSATVSGWNTFQATQHVTIHGKIFFTGSPKNMFGSYNRTYDAMQKCYQMVSTEKVLTDTEVAQVKTLISNIGVADATDMSLYTKSLNNFFRGDDKWSHLYLADWDFSLMGTEFGTTSILVSTFRQNDQVEYLDISGWDLSPVAAGVRNMNMFSRNATNLVTMELGLNGEPYSDLVDDFKLLEFEDTSLSSDTIDNILLGLVNSGVTGGTVSFTNPSYGVGNPPSTTGEGYIDTLRARTWTVTVPGGY